MSRYLWEVMDTMMDVDLPNSVWAAAAPLRKAQKKAVDRETVALITYVAAKAASEAGLDRTAFLDLCNDEYSKAKRKPPSEEKTFSEADFVKAMSGMAAPAVIKAVWARMQQQQDKETKGADK